jgi:aromatase
MPRIQHQIYIGCPPAEVFALTNDIDRWTELFDAYTHSEVLRREDAGRFTVLTFRLRNREGLDWRSWRILDHEALVTVSERESPLYPFAFMHLRWTYEPSGSGTTMTWTQDFELSPDYPVPTGEMRDRMDVHGHHNQARIKAYLEGGAR